MFSTSVFGLQVGVIFLQALNHFQRYAYVRQAHARESRMKDLSHGLAPPPHLVSRTPSNRSEVSENSSYIGEHHTYII